MNWARHREKHVSRRGNNGLNSFRVRIVWARFARRCVIQADRAHWSRYDNVNALFMTDATCQWRYQRHCRRLSRIPQRSTARRSLPVQWPQAQDQTRGPSTSTTVSTRSSVPLECRAEIHGLAPSRFRTKKRITVSSVACDIPKGTLAQPVSCIDSSNRRRYDTVNTPFMATSHDNRIIRRSLLALIDGEVSDKSCTLTTAQRCSLPDGGSICWAPTC